ncbi:MAG: hypothetical protein ABIW32_03120 [Terrimesophilobacter sp.]
MNTSVTPTRTPQETRRHEHPPQLVVHMHPTVARRVGLVDRIALHLGVALITWGRRPLTIESRERRANRVEQHLARLERERAAERMRHLIAPRL